MLGRQPSNVHVHQYIPQELLLPYCAAVVTHGGAGLTLGALAFGLQLLVVPQGADQFYNADRVVAAGAAARLMPDRLGADSARDAVRMLLHDAAFQTAAHRIKKEIDTMPDPREPFNARTTHQPRAHSRPSCPRGVIGRRGRLTSPTSTERSGPPPPTAAVVPCASVRASPRAGSHLAAVAGAGLPRGLDRRAHHGVVLPLGAQVGESGLFEQGAGAVVEEGGRDLLAGGVLGVGLDDSAAGPRSGPGRPGGRRPRRRGGGSAVDEEAGEAVVRRAVELRLVLLAVVDVRQLLRRYELAPRDGDVSVEDERSVGAAFGTSRCFRAWLASASYLLSPRLWN